MKSHEVLIRILNNIGIIGSILAAIADLVFVIIFVMGVEVNSKNTAVIIFSIINALIGVLINGLLRYQGKRYAEIENKELVERYYTKKIEKEKHHINMNIWLVITSAKDIIWKGCTTAFSIFGVIYISIEGSKNPIQILITIVTLIMFACFGLINMSNAYNRFYNVEVPYMEKKIIEKEIIKDVDN